jgi:hypothetical protein
LWIEELRDRNVEIYSRRLIGEKSLENQLEGGGENRWKRAIAIDGLLIQG